MIDPVVDAKLEGWADAVNGAPPNAALPFIALLHRYDASAWSSYVDAYNESYQRQAALMRRLA